jgi:hypothetical protein
MIRIEKGSYLFNAWCIIDNNGDVEGGYTRERAEDLAKAYNNAKEPIRGAPFRVAQLIEIETAPLLRNGKF